jgi:hypothetical protein
VKFKPDPERVELLRDHVGMVESIISGRVALGDCDDSSVIVGALVESMGIVWRFVAVGRNGGPLAHVLTCAHVLFCGTHNNVQLDHLIPIDPQETDAVGKWPAGVGRWQVEEIYE